MKTLLPVFSRGLGVAVQGAFTLLVPLTSSEFSNSDRFFGVWALIQIYSIIGQFGNGWRASIELSEERTGSATEQFVKLMKRSALPLAVGAVALMATTGEDLLAHPTLLVCYLLVYLLQTLLLLIADMFRGLHCYNAGGFVATGCGPFISATVLGILFLAGVRNVTLESLWILAAVSFIVATIAVVAWFVYAWKHRTVVESSSATPMTWGNAVRFFILRLVQVGISQMPMILLSRYGVESSATAFAVAQRMTVFSSIFVVHMNSVAPTLFAGLRRRDQETSNLFNAMWRNNFLAALGSGLAGAVAAYLVGMAIQLPEQVFAVYAMLTLGQLISVGGGPVAQALVFFSNRPLETILCLSNIAVFATYLFLPSPLSPVMLAIVLVMVHLVNAIVAHLLFVSVEGHLLFHLGRR